MAAKKGNMNSELLKREAPPVAETEAAIRQNLSDKNRETKVPAKGAVDDRNIAEGQVFSYDRE